MVRGLKTLIDTQILDARKSIAIDEKIVEWKSDHPDVTPIIVVDFPAFYRSICHTTEAQLDVLFGKHDRLLAATESILKRFLNLGVQLKFFLAGPARFLKNSAVMNKKRQDNIRTTDIILEMIKKNSTPASIVKRLKGSGIYNNSSYAVAATMLTEQYYHMTKSFENELEQDIATCASLHNAMAVMSGNSDFILVNGQWSFWDVQTFDPVAFKILEINKIKIRDFLGIAEEQMPLFGALTSKHLPFNLSNNFLRSLGDKKDYLPNVATFIKTNFRHNEVVDPNKVAQILSSTDISKHAEIIDEALKIFANEPLPDPPVEDELSTYVKFVYNSCLYEFLNDLPVVIRPLFICKSTYRHFMSASILIHRRQMGVVLKHKSCGQRRLIICFNEFKLFRDMVTPIYPPMDVPPLLTLCRGAGVGTIFKTKLQLLSWITSDHLNYEVIEFIPKSYLCAVLTLVFMVEHYFITNEEADCILYCLQQYNTNPESMSSLKHPNSITKRPFQVIFLYDKFHQFMVFSMNTVGLSDLVEYNQLDGVYFHQQYEQFIHISEADRELFMNKVQEYRIYAKSN